MKADLNMSKEMFEMQTVELWDKVYSLSEKKKINRTAINQLVNYYIKFLLWDEIKSLNYTIELFNNGTIELILGLR
jgi:hypothetical protein